MKVGVEGVAQAFYEPYEYINPVTLETETLPALVEIDGWWQKGPELVVDQLTIRKLTVNHVRDKAADRGTSVHQGFEDWCRTGLKPNPLNFPETERGYVEGLVRFIEEVNPEPVFTELMVGSARHGYAGRFDLLARTQAVEVQTGPRTKRQIPAGLGLIDLKTSKGIYMSHKLQLAAYAEAFVECGYGRTDYEAVLLVRSDGRYDFKVSEARPSQFLAVRNAYNAVQGL
jgi:hypothetical protein